MVSKRWSVLAWTPVALSAAVWAWLAFQAGAPSQPTNLPLYGRQADSAVAPAMPPVRMAEVSRALGARPTLTAETPAPLPPAQRVRVLGVAADSRSGVAVLSVDGAASRLFKVGAEVLPGVQIHELDRLGIVLKTLVDGKLDRVDLPKPSVPALSRRDTAPSPAPLVSGMKSTPQGANPSAYTLPRNAIAAPAPGHVTIFPPTSSSK